MTEKNGFAKFLDSLVEKKKEEADDVLNMLPKPDTQEIGNGYILWRWNAEAAIIESILATRNSNELGLEKDSYIVNISLPHSEECAYTLFNDTAKEIGSALLSAWNWQHIWKLHAGDFLLDVLSQEPVSEQVAEQETVVQPELFTPDDSVEVVEAEPVESA